MVLSIFGTLCMRDSGLNLRTVVNDLEAADGELALALELVLELLVLAAAAQLLLLQLLLHLLLVVLADLGPGKLLQAEPAADLLLVSIFVQATHVCLMNKN